jgi:hypothetical protein
MLDTTSLIVEGVAIPDSKLAREITEVVQDTVTQRGLRFSEQNFRIDKWSVCRG